MSHAKENRAEAVYSMIEKDMIVCVRFVFLFSMQERDDTARCGAGAGGEKTSPSRFSRHAKNALGSGRRSSIRPSCCDMKTSLASSQLIIKVWDALRGKDGVCLHISSVYNLSRRIFAPRIPRPNR